MQDPAAYESYKTIAARDANQFVPQLIADMKWEHNEKILDYGCGAGSTGANLILPIVKAYNSKMFSVDSSHQMVEFAKKNYSDADVTYAVGNILREDFPFRSLKFHKIFSIYVFHYIKDFK